ncbi:MAG TPA: CusA/CzcA family heavy metal efflux RND transporter [Hyphomonadaceae bacterium]|jgi:cobalt-zinc-cadmium resistance protein CzcA|nr:CusA/CzcA family heavy metal efflux RND transporter [Hyphomonadaceae bacterium]
MLSALVRAALTQRIFVLGLTLALIVGGLFATLRLPIDAFPDISTTQVKLILKAPGMTPEEVEQRVVAPLEMELLGIPKQRVLRSVAKYAIADITIDFEDSADIYWARQQVSERLSAAADAMPANISGGLAPISTPLSDVFMFTIEGGDLSTGERRTLLDWTIRPALRTIAGVADVNTLGGLVRTFEVQPDTAALAAAGLTISDLATAIEGANRNDGAGRINVGDEALIVRSVGAIRTLGDLGSIVVRREGGAVTLLRDVAETRFGSLTRYGAVTKDGAGEAVQGIVLSLRGADANSIVRDVRARLAELAPSLPEGVTVEPFYDRSELISHAVRTVQEALLEAIALVVVLLIIFLGNMRASIVVAFMLPMAALFTFLMMQLTGMSANLMSLGGLAIAIGLIVDAAVVVVENTVERLAHEPASARTPWVHLIFRSASEVAAPVSSGILVICLVFLPLLALEGLEGKLFRPVALTIIFALAGSLVMSLTVVPVLSSFLLTKTKHREPLLMRILTPAYARVLNLSLRRPIALFAIAALGLVAAAAAYTQVGKIFMPTMDEGSVIMQTAKLPSVNLDRSVEADLAVQKALLADVPEIESIVGRVGSDELGLDPMGLNESDMFVVLKPKSEWREPDKAWIVDEMRKTMETLPGIEPAFTQPIEMRTSEMLTGARGDLAVKIFGPDLSTLANLAGKIQTTIQTVSGATEVFTLSNDATDFMQLDIDRLATGASGLSISQTEDELRAMLEGVNAGTVIESGRRTSIVVRGDSTLRESPERFADVPMAAGGGSIHVGDIAEIRREPGAVKIERENASRFALVQAFVDGRDLVGFVEDAQSAVATQVVLPPGYRLEWGGEFENQRRASERLGLVVPIALAMIFVVLFVTLRSIRQSILIFANVPLALVGGILALYLSGQYFSVPASIGFIALLGIAVLNGLVLVSYFNQLLAAGHTVDVAVRTGAVRRLRPVLMTATIAAVGLVPLLFADGPGSEIQKPLAIVVIGGLVSSTALTLLLLPVLFRRYGVSPGSARTSQKAAKWSSISAD